MIVGIDVGKERLYSSAFKEKGRNDVIKWEVLKVANNQELKVTFIDKNSDFRQGIWFATDKGIEVNGNTFNQVSIWEDTAPREFTIKCFTEVGLLSFYNIWDKGRGKDSQSHTSGMILEEKENKLIYCCNDFGYETKFNKLVFSIERV